MTEPALKATPNSRLVVMDGSANPAQIEVQIQLQNLASRMAMYRDELIAAGLPRVLVAQLVRDYHAEFVSGYTLA